MAIQFDGVYLPFTPEKAPENPFLFFCAPKQWSNRLYHYARYGISLAFRFQAQTEIRTPEIPGMADAVERHRIHQPSRAGAYHTDAPV
jgi:hypothetical protein